MIKKLILKQPTNLLQRLIIDPFLAYTTVFPIIIIMEGLAANSRFAKSWIDTVDYFSKHIFNAPPEDLTTGQLLFFFFAFVWIFSYLTRIIFKLINPKLQLGYKHAVVFMTMLYITALASTYFLGKLDETLFLFSLTFYLFNVFSIFSTHIIKKTHKEMDNSHTI